MKNTKTSSEEPEQKEIDNSSSPPKITIKIRLKRSVRILVLINLCLMHSFLSVAVGVLSSSVMQVKQDLNLTDNQYGSLGTILGLGNVFGSIIYTYLADKMSRKILILGAMCLCSGSHLLFYISSNYYFALFIRFISGLGQVCGYPYFQSWPDQFGIKKYKAIITTIMGLAGSLGYVWGYLINIILGSHNWKFGLTIETMAMGTCVLILSFVPRCYFDNDFFFYANAENKPKDIKENDSVESFGENKDSLFKVHEKNKEKDEQGLTMLFLTNIEFLLMVITKSNVYFVNMAQIFWYSDYCATSLGVTNPKYIFISYTLNLTVANTIGMMISGSIAQCIGGYEKRGTVIMMLISQIFATIFAIISSYMGDFVYFTIINSLFNLFFGVVSNFCIVVGIRSIAARYKGNASGFFILICEITAFLPAPIVYSSIKTYFNDGKIAMRCVLYYPIVALIALIFENIYRKMIENKEKEEKNIPLREV